MDHKLVKNDKKRFRIQLNLSKNTLNTEYKIKLRRQTTLCNAINCKKYKYNFRQITDDNTYVAIKAVVVKLL